MSAIPHHVIRVVVAEDSFLVREGVVRILDGEDDIEVAGVCGDLDSLLRMVEEQTPDVVLTDIRMPPSGSDEGIRAATLLRESHPAVGVVVLSQYDDPEYAIALLEGGAEGRGYLLKDRLDLTQLLAAVREVARGGSLIDPKVVESLLDATTRRRQSPLSTLTQRELEALGHMAQGRNNAAIAAAMSFSERAVEKHINSIFLKLGLTEEKDVNRRVKAVLLYLAERDG